MTIIETQTKATSTTPAKVRVYQIEGPQEATVWDFWQWLKDTRVIEDFEIIK
jgi:hypothetical protein